MSGITRSLFKNRSVEILDLDFGRGRGSGLEVLLGLRRRVGNRGGFRSALFVRYNYEHRAYHRIWGNEYVKDTDVSEPIKADGFLKALRRGEEPGKIKVR